MIHAFRPHRQYYDAGATHWRTGKVASITGGTATIKLLCDPGFVRTISVSTSSLPNQSKGAPLCARVDISGGPAAYTILELRGSNWASDAPKDEAASIDRNDPCWPVIPRDITGEPIEWEWTQ